MLIQPSRIAVSPTKRSSLPIATASSDSPTVHTPSHWFSCGHTRPQMDGSRLVSVRMSYAPRRLPSPIFWMKPGMLMPTGQPEIQGSSGHIRQRSDSRKASSKFLARTMASCSRIGVRSWGMVRIVFFLAIPFTSHSDLKLQLTPAACIDGTALTDPLPTERFLRRIGQLEHVIFRTCRLAVEARRLGHAAAFRPAFMRVLLDFRVTAQARHQVVEVDQVAVEVGAVDTGELDLVAHLDPA